MELSDGELVARTAAGDEAALRLLYERYRARVMTYASCILGARDRAEDVLQETFIRIFRHAGRFRRGGRFEVWALTIAANLCRDELRKARRRGPLARPRPPEEAARAVDGAPSPRREAQGREFAARLREALGTLPVEAREAVALRFLEGFSYEEIAAVADCPLGTVKSRLHAGVRALREMLREG